MHRFLLPFAALALAGAKDAPAPADTRDVTTPVIRSLSPSPEFCRERITHARETSGQPPLKDRGPASADNPYLIHAVDKRIDGCAVMVMMGDAKDIRPLPAKPEGPVLLIPAAGK